MSRLGHFEPRMGPLRLKIGPCIPDMGPPNPLNCLFSFNFDSERLQYFRHVPMICPRGGGGLVGPQGNPLQNQKLFRFGPLFLGVAPFYEQKKNEKKLEKFELGPNPNSYKQGCGVGVEDGVGFGRSRPFCLESESEWSR